MGTVGPWVRLRCCLQDAKPLEVYSVDFMVDSTQLGFLVSDRDRNLLVYMYLPEGEPLPAGTACCHGNGCRGVGGMGRAVMGWGYYGKG
eukprot:XP_025003529.1 cleavage and polyadenylation specificity factor subunit 1 [Gallus gallus]